MYVATYVKVTCIGKIVRTLMADVGIGGLGLKPPENFFLALQTVGKSRQHLSIYDVLIFA